MALLVGADYKGEEGWIARRVVLTESGSQE